METDRQTDTGMGGISSQPPRKGMGHSPLGWAEKGSAPKGQPQPMESARGDAAPEQYLIPQQLWEGKPTRQWGSQWGRHPSVPIPRPRGMQSRALPPDHTVWADTGAVLWATAVSAAPSGVPTFPAPPRSVRVSVSLLLPAGKFDLSPLQSQHEELEGQGTSAGTPGKLPSNPDQPIPAPGSPNALS